MAAVHRLWQMYIIVGSLGFIDTTKQGSYTPIENNDVTELGTSLQSRSTDVINNVQAIGKHNKVLVLSNETSDKTQDENVLYNRTMKDQPSQNPPYNEENQTEVDKRSLADLPAATDEQIRHMCRNYHCDYNPPTIVAGDYYRGLSHMNWYLRTNRCKLVGKKLKIKLPGPLFSQILRRDGFYAIQSHRNIKIVLRDEYRILITENTIGVTFQVETELTGIEDGFFEQYFPNLESLKIFKGIQPQRALPGLPLGYLPKLKRLDIGYPINGDIDGCTLPAGEDSCFAGNMVIKLDDRRYRKKPKLGFTNFHLKKRVKTFELDFTSTSLKSTNILEGLTLDTVNLAAMSTAFIAGLSFKGTIVRTFFNLNGGLAADVNHFTTHLDSILHNPDLAKMWHWEWISTSKVRIPAIFGTSLEQPFDGISGKELGKTTCNLAEKIAQYANDFSRDVIVAVQKTGQQKTSRRVRRFRGIYIDITKLIDQQKNELQDFDEMEVTAFHMHVSASRTIPYKINAWYMKITSSGKSAIYHEYIKGHPGIRSIGSTCSQINLSDSVDAIFVQAYKVCTAIHLAQDRSLGGLSNNDNSVGNQMWTYSLPAKFKGKSDQIAKAQQMTVKVGEFMETWKEVSREIAMRVPYLSLQYQKENLVILLNMAESIVQEKRSMKLVKAVEKVKVEILNRQDKLTISMLQTEYKRTVSQVLISTRRAHDIKKKLDSTVQLVKEVSTTFEMYRAEMEAANSTFMAGVRRAKAFAYAEVAAAITSSVLSFFTGGFSPGKIARAAKKVKDLAIKLKKIMKLSVIFKKLSNLIKILRNIKKQSKIASQAVQGRVSRLFTRMKNFRIKRNNYLKHLITSSAPMPAQRVLLLKKQHQNEVEIRKMKLILKKVKKAVNTVANLNDIMQGIVEAEKANVALANAYEEGVVQDVKVSGAERVTQKDIQQALANEFIISTGDRAQQLQEFKKTLQDFQLTHSKSVIQEGEKLNAADVLEWDAANANIEGTMDASLSMDIPETTSFKAALLKMNLAGKVKTQAMIDEAAIRVDLDRARFETTTYFKEGAAILRQIKEIRDVLKKRNSNGEDLNSDKFKKQYRKHIRKDELKRELKEFNVKFNILISSLDYCSAYYYFHLSACPPERIFDFDTKLEDTIFQQREVQRQSILELEDMYPPPQELNNRTFSFSAPNSTCQCLQRVNNLKGFNTLYRDWLNCAESVVTSNDPTNVETRRQLERLDRYCKINAVSEMKKFNRTSVQILINDDPGHSRLRVDDLEVILHGVRTDDGVIKMTIESSGLSQDQFRGEIFNFYGDKWQRDFSYYSPESITNHTGSKNDIIKEVHLLEVANVYRSFRDVYRSSTMFTTWIIKLDPDNNRGLDVSGLHRIDMKFSGSFVSSGGYKKKRLPDIENSLR